MFLYQAALRCPVCSVIQRVTTWPCTRLIALAFCIKTRLERTFGSRGRGRGHSRGRGRGHGRGRGLGAFCPPSRLHLVSVLRLCSHVTTSLRLNM